MTLIEKLNELELNYRNLLETIDVGFYQVTLDGYMLSHNRAHNIILGYDPLESLESMDVRQFWQDPKDRNKYRDHILKEGYTKNYLCHALKKGGEKIVVELNSHLIRDEKGKPIRIDGTFIDVTEKFKLEKQLVESEEKYRLISENANEIITVQNDEFQIEYVNEIALKNILGYSSREVIGKQTLQFAHPDDKKETIIKFNKLLKKSVRPLQSRYRHKDGHYVWLEINLESYFNSQGKKKYLTISRDITKIKEAEQMLKKSEKRYREAFNRANFYRDLFAHDINNILHIIGSSAELISFYLGDSEKSKVIEDIGNIIKKQVQRGAKLVSNVHTLSKLEEEEINAQPIEICSLMENATDFVKKSFSGRDVHINIECIDVDHITVNANELLQDVFENLLINSVKYNENYVVKVKIVVSKAHIDGKNYNKIEFIDNGIGVPPDRKEIIFKRGNRELKGAKGMGLGLSLVKKILKTFNGKIWVEDKVKGDYSKGCKFIMVLPELTPTN